MEKETNMPSKAFYLKHRSDMLILSYHNQVNVLDNYYEIYKIRDKRGVLVALY